MKTQQGQWLDLQPGTVWPGAVDEFVRLLASIGAHCTCRQTVSLTRGAGSCPAHQLLADQRTLDHLVYVRCMRDRFIESEWCVDAEGSEQKYPRRLTARLGWRPGVVAYALAALLVLAGLNGVVQPATSSSTPNLDSWQTR